MPTNPYTRLKEESEATISKLTAENNAFRHENAKLEAAWNASQIQTRTAQDTQAKLTSELAKICFYLIINQNFLIDAYSYLVSSPLVGKRGKALAKTIITALERDALDSSLLYGNRIVTDSFQTIGTAQGAVDPRHQPKD